MGTATNMGTAMATARKHSPDRRLAGARQNLPQTAQLVRLSVFVTIAAVLFLATLRTTLAEVLRVSRPADALAWNPANAGASAGLARRLVSVGELESGKRLAERAIERDLLEPSAFWTLGVIAKESGMSAEAAKLMALSRMISRRDRPTTLWLLGQAVANRDYSVALSQLDIAMRSSSRGVEDFMPVLMAANDDPRMSVALQRQLDRNPIWKSTFLMSLAIGGRDLSKIVALSRGRLDPKRADERAVIARLVRRLVDEGRPALAWSFYLQAVGETAGNRAVGAPNLHFTGNEGYPPFDWQLTEREGLSGLIEPRRDGGAGYALATVSQDGRTGEVARRLIGLPTGRYALFYDAGGVPRSYQDRLEVRVICAQPDSTTLLESRPEASGTGPIITRSIFSVPSGCPWQFVSVNARDRADPAESPWIANIRAVPL